MTQLRKGVKQLVDCFNGLRRTPKLLLKYGTMIFFVVLTAGTALLLINVTTGKFDPYTEFLGQTIIRYSFMIFLEAVVGAIGLDYAIGKKK